MPQFSPGQSKNAIVPATVQPGGLSCHLEVFLGPNESTKVATSGLKAFTSTGAQQSIAAPVVMPAAAGTYHVYIDLYAAGYYLAGYQATEDVVIATPANALVTPELVIESLNDVPFVETGIDDDGIPYAVLREPVVVEEYTGLPWTIKWRTANRVPLWCGEPGTWHFVMTGEGDHIGIDTHVGRYGPVCDDVSFGQGGKLWGATTVLSPLTLPHSTQNYGGLVDGTFEVRLSIRDQRDRWYTPFRIYNMLQITGLPEWEPEPEPPPPPPPSISASGYFIWPQSISFGMANVIFGVSGSPAPFRVAILTHVGGSASTDGGNWIVNRFYFTGPTSGVVTYSSRLGAEMWVHPNLTAIPSDSESARRAAGWVFVTRISGTD